MLAAREEEVPVTPGGARPAADDDAPGPDAGDDQGPSGGRRGKKRSRQESAGGLEEEEAITAARVNALTQLVARVFARAATQQMTKAELLEGVNAGLMAGEMPFDDEEFDAGLTVMESRNKIFVAQESGEVMLVG